MSGYTRKSGLKFLEASIRYSRQDIRAIIGSLPRIRNVGIPYDSKNGCILLFGDVDEMRREAPALRQRFAVPPLVTALDLSEDIERVSESLGGGVIALDSIRHGIHRELVLWIEQTALRKRTRHLTKAAYERGHSSFYYSRAVVDAKAPNTKFFTKNADKIERVVNTLADEESVLCYLSRVKSLMFGDPGFARISNYRQYVHPVVQAIPGDIVCEGGVGGAPHTTRMFARMASPGGKVFAFEPVESLYRMAKESVQKENNIVLENLGLWSHPARMDIHLALNVSSLVSQKGRDKTQSCELTSIDRYFDNRAKPTLVKLDIEGAEQSALAGAENLIREQRPKLQICLYHSPNDFLDIPLKLADAELGYRLYVGHHTPFMNECLLYAIAA